MSAITKAARRKTGVPDEPTLWLGGVEILPRLNLSSFLP